MISGIKTCTKCKIDKPLDDFRLRIRKDRNPYREPSCRQCERDRAQEHRPAYFEKNKDNIRRKDRDRRYAKHIKYKYGMTPEDYQVLWEGQSGLCAICQEPMDKPEIDHCHVTGKVRSLLCHLHNKLLGLAQDDPWILEKAAAYLRDHDPKDQSN
jgi:hypothetical protein